MNKETILKIVSAVSVTIVGVLLANQIQKAIDKARVSQPNQ